MDNFLKRLSNVQNRMNVPKNQRNDFGGFNFRSCEDILEVAKPILAENSLLLTLSDSIENIGGKNYVTATATLFDLEGDSHIAVSASARETDSKAKFDASQLTGSASSYARKYALNGLFNLDDNKDADTNEYGKQQNSNSYRNQQKNDRPAPQAVKCACCGHDIINIQLKNGKKYTAEELIEQSEARYGKPLCCKCFIEEVNKDGTNQV